MLTKERRKFVFNGDFNVNFTPNLPLLRGTINLLNTVPAIQLVSHLTRVTGASSALLDHIYRKPNISNLHLSPCIV